jgi:tetratricopeptide (TPR) repeat protein
MMVSADDQDDTDVERLLTEGLELYGHNRIDEAIARWQAVLAIAPDDPRAHDYLDNARPKANVIPLHPRASPLREQLQALLADHRYEEALDALLAARSGAPADESISRSIRLVKEHLIRAYIERIENLDRVPHARPGHAEASRLPAEAQEVLRLVDGISSVDDILHACRLGQFRTLRALLALVDQQLIEWSPHGRVPATLRAEAVVRRVLADDTSAAAAAPRPPPALAPPAAEVYAAWFADATRAYLRRDYAAAEQLFARCVAARPDDARARHNLDSLRRRRGRTTP